MTVVPGKSPYREAATKLLAEHQIHVRAWRSNNTGVAYSGLDIIEAPEPRGIATFLTLAHEVGHQALRHKGTSKPRWQEETEAWVFAAEQAKRFGFPISKARQQRIAKSLAYSYDKALRRASEPHKMMQEIEQACPKKWWRLVDVDLAQRLLARM